MQSHLVAGMPGATKLWLGYSRAALSRRSAESVLGNAQYKQCKTNFHKREKSDGQFRKWH